MPYDFTLMRFPRPTQPGLEAAELGPQAIQRGQIRQELAAVPRLTPRDAGRSYAAELADGLHLDVLIDPREPPEFLTVEFDRYASQADYRAARAVVDQICAALRLTITDDPDAGGDPHTWGTPATSSGGLLDRIRGLFGGRTNEQ